MAQALVQRMAQHLAKSHGSSEASTLGSSSQSKVDPVSPTKPSRPLVPEGIAALVPKGIAKSQCINVFNPKAEEEKKGLLAPITGPKPTPGEWEVLEAIVDSGATVPVLNPTMAKAYPLEESAASKEGVEYEIANGDVLANLGQKRFAVMTKEGTLRGYESQAANVSKCLNAVRSMVAGKSAVCFGLGPEGDQHLIINRLTGEVNAMEDDGINYIQRLWVVPENEIGKVQTALAISQDFPGQGR